MKKITVRLGERSYSILIGQNLLSSIGSLLKPLKLGSKLLIVSNKKIVEHDIKSEFEKLKASLKRAGYEVVAPYLFRHSDERAKSQGTLFDLWKHMARHRLERSSTVLAFGGGVVGDVSGLAASTYMRGVSVVQVPTTLLAQVDAGIGGKTGIDLPSVKNIVGTFYQPRMVVADVETLRKLTIFRAREIRNGFAEIIKYGMIQDVKLFELLERAIERFFSSVKKKSFGTEQFSFLEAVVWRSAKVKAKIVEEDERETKGVRLVLNYGHTFAHAFEAASNYELPHGEAVGLGMALAARLARRRGMIGAGVEKRQNDLIDSAGLPTRLDGLHLSPGRVIRHMLLDKKKKDGKLRFVLPLAVGRVKVVEGVSLSEVKKVLSDLGDQ